MATQDALTDAEIVQVEATNISNERGITFDRKGDLTDRARAAAAVLTMGAYGAELYVVPDDGRIRPADAWEIIQQREIAVADSGLFCDFQQSWRYVRHA